VVLAGAGNEPEPVYAWMSESGDGSASLIYGSPETAEDLVFILTCRNEDKATGLTVYVDIPDTEVADPVDINLAAAGGAKHTIGGAIDTDEMSGFHFAVAEDFKIKPLIALLKETGEVAVTTGSVVTKLPEKGRGTELANFAGACTLD
jgi:hypothetical protein